MDSNVQRLLSDKLYDKRKAGALELEANIRTALAENNSERIHKIVNQLCHDYAYAVHQPHARNGGLIGLAAAAIALGSEVPAYLGTIIPPVLACFSDQDARVRYYACESMYNIAKVAKGEILLYFNDVFDALCKLAADTELSVKNGAELLDRLVKDIVAESASGYVSIVEKPETAEEGKDDEDEGEDAERKRTAEGGETAFSLPRFIPLLRERIHVLNPFTRTFLVSWITLLDSIPDLELVAYLPSFLGGLLKFLSDPNQDVHTTTKVALDRFLNEIKKIAAVKKGIEESRRSRGLGARQTSEDSVSAVAVDSPEADVEGDEPQKGLAGSSELRSTNGEAEEGAADDSISHNAAEDDDDAEYDEKDHADAEDALGEGEWIPGQDVQIDYQHILDILVTFLSSSSESGKEEVQLTTLKWIETFLDICPEDILAFTPRLLAQVLPALSDDADKVRQAAGRVNQALRAYVISLPEEGKSSGDGQEQNASGVSGTLPPTGGPTAPGNQAGVRGVKEMNGNERQQSVSSLSSKQAPGRKPTTPEPQEVSSKTERRSSEQHLAITTTSTTESASSDVLQHTDLDYEAAVNALTLQFLHQHEATRVAALQWLIMLHQKSPRRILAIQDATFPALLKTLSDPAEAVVTRDLLLLSQISKSSDDSFFTSFMVSLLKLFATDRRLLETRGNLIIRQLSVSLSPEKIYRTMADGLERDDSGAPGVGDDTDFAAIMVQNLNNNLITAPEMQELRKRLRNLNTSDGQTFFTALFRAWCVNAIATFSLCLLAQAYEQAYHLLQIIGDLEMTVNMLIQIDKLVQLLESPVFTYLRIQLLEPERHPHLYKCLYGLLMLLPQSSAFAALKNRLNSVSAIGFLHIPRGAQGIAMSGPGSAGGSSMQSGATPSSVSTFERQNRLKSREEGGIRWTELLEKFRVTQERVRRNQLRLLGGEMVDEGAAGELAREESKEKDFALTNALQPSSSSHVTPMSAPARPESALSLGRPGSGGLERERGKGDGKAEAQGAAKHKSGLSQLGRLATGRKKEKDKK